MDFNPTVTPVRLTIGEIHIHVCYHCLEPFVVYA